MMGRAVNKWHKLIFRTVNTEAIDVNSTFSWNHIKSVRLLAYHFACLEPLPNLVSFAMLVTVQVHSLQSHM
jgi:hypothetical protein